MKAPAYSPPQQSIPTLLIRHRIQQRGGGVELLHEADGAPIQGVPAAIDFNVRFQPTIQASNIGATLSRAEARPEPFPVWTKPVAPEMNTLICWDPDAPEKSWLHWLVVNCTDESPASGKELTPWFPPGPPPGSGEHRYIFGLFKQAAPIDISPMPNAGGFNAAEFATKHGLTPLAYKGIRVKHE
jgi:phosphatidylethanolamine-binding protein